MSESPSWLRGELATSDPETYSVLAYMDALIAGWRSRRGAVVAENDIRLMEDAEQLLSELEAEGKVCKNDLLHCRNDVRDAFASLRAVDT